LLSTITVWPRLCVSFSASARASTSVVPPAGNGTIRLIGLFGQACAIALPPDIATASPMAWIMRRRLKVWVSLMLVSKWRCMRYGGPTLCVGGDSESTGK
jgi:hypothetical protein